MDADGGNASNPRNLCQKESRHLTLSKPIHRIATTTTGVTGADLPRRDSAISRRLFFLDLGAGRVLSAHPDGSDLKVLVDEGRKLPDGLAVDTAAGHLYWTNMGSLKANDGSILRSDLDGKCMTIIIPPGGRFIPKQLQIDKVNG